MRPSKIQAKLRRNEPVLIVGISFTDQTLYELTSLMGFDGIWMDMEHHAHSVETAANLIRAARAGGTTEVMVRPAKGEFMRLGRLLEAGARGIMYPRCDDAEEARQVVAAAKFAPLGKRGFDSGNADNPYCSVPLAEYIKQANDETFLVIQLEDESAVANAREIAEVKGVDVLFFGPGDFSILSGIPGQFDHPKIQKATEKIATAAREAGKHWGLPCGTPERAKEIMGMGARFIAHGADIIQMQMAFQTVRERFGPLGFTFDAQF
jgi:4-hydroxy-2-oxoheptanedioate aldolase